MFIKEKKGIERIFMYYLVNLTWIEKANKISDYLRWTIKDFLFIFLINGHICFSLKYIFFTFNLGVVYFCGDKVFL